MRQVEKKTIVLAFGVFDRLHPGHIWFLKQAKKMAKELAVVVSRDNVVKSRKKIHPSQSEKIRLRNIKKLKFVNRALLGNHNPKHNYGMVKIIRPDVIAVGYDQKPNLTTIKKDLFKLGLTPTIKRLPAYKPERFKSSLIKMNRALI